MPGFLPRRALVAMGRSRPCDRRFRTTVINSSRTRQQPAMLEELLAVNTRSHYATQKHPRCFKSRTMPRPDMFAHGRQRTSRITALWVDAWHPLRGSIIGRTAKPRRGHLISAVRCRASPRRRKNACTLSLHALMRALGSDPVAAGRNTTHTSRRRRVAITRNPHRHTRTHKSSSKER